MVKDLKQSERIKKLWLNPDYRAKQSQAHKHITPPSWLGKKRKPFTDEHRAKLSETHKGLLVGEKHFAWKGDKVGYVALHDYIKAKLGTPNFCSIDKNHIGRFVWANKSGNYTRDLNDWWSLCQSCNLTDGIKKHPRFRRDN